MGTKAARNLKKNQNQRRRRAKPKKRADNRKRKHSGHGGFRPGAGRTPGVPNKENAEIIKILDEEVDYRRMIRRMYSQALHGNNVAQKILLDRRYGKTPLPFVNLNPGGAPLAAIYEIPAFNYGPAVPAAPAAAAAAVPAAPAAAAAAAPEPGAKPGA